MKNILKELVFTLVLGVLIIGTFVVVLKPTTYIPDEVVVTATVESEQPDEDINITHLDGTPANPAAEADEQEALVYIMYFMSPHCQYCKEHLADLNKYHTLKNVEVIGLSKGNAKDTEALIAEYNIVFNVYLVDKVPANGVPYTVVYAYISETQSYEVFAEHIGAWPQDLQEYLDELTQVASEIENED